MQSQTEQMLPRRVLDKLVDGMGTFCLEELQGDIDDMERIDFRLPAGEKADIHATAESCGLTVSEYLRTLHRIVMNMLKFEALR